jgi:hypothetical protein
VNVNSRVPCGQGKAEDLIFISVIPAKCGIKAKKIPFALTPVFWCVKEVIA